MKLERKEGRKQNKGLHTKEYNVSMLKSDWQSHLHPWRSKEVKKGENLKDIQNTDVTQKDSTREKSGTWAGKGKET